MSIVSCARLRPDLLCEESPEGVEILQLTNAADMPSAHVYMEAQVFTPDSKRLLLHRSANAHGGPSNGAADDSSHAYLLCDVARACEQHPIIEGPCVTAPSVAPDGKMVFYIVDETRRGRGRVSLERVKIDGTGRERIMTIDAPLPGMKHAPSRIYPLSTISSDGNRLATTAYLGDGRKADSPYGLLVFDLNRATVDVVLNGPTWCNAHPQYCRSKHPDKAHDLLIQEMHGWDHDPATGHVSRRGDTSVADLHVIRDDGAGLRDMPFGRHWAPEHCVGHQCWRGGTDWVISAVSAIGKRQWHLIEAKPVPHEGHRVSRNTESDQRRIKGCIRGCISARFPLPQCSHFATDAAGDLLITDDGPPFHYSEQGALRLARLAGPGSGPAAESWFLLFPKTCRSDLSAHAHPFLSPDGALAFFNSDESGVLQAYMIRGLENLTVCPSDPAGPAFGRSATLEDGNDASTE